MRVGFAIEIEETDDPRFYGVVVPDIRGCTTSGRSIEDAITQAREAIALHLEHLAELGLALPRRRRKPQIRIVAGRHRVLLRGATRPLASRGEAAQSVCARHGAKRE